MSNVSQGLAIMLMGLGITFTALGIFIGVMLVLQKLFPAEVEGAEEPEEPAEQDKTVSAMVRDTSEDEIAAAITLALAHLYAREAYPDNLGKSLEAGSGPWWTAGQFERHALTK
jgi:sodium pump decarboxylase gamma subunit